MAGVTRWASREWANHNIARRRSDLDFRLAFFGRVGLERIVGSHRAPTTARGRGACLELPMLRRPWLEDYEPGRADRRRSPGCLPRLGDGGLAPMGFGGTSPGQRGKTCENVAVLSRTSYPLQRQRHLLERWRRGRRLEFRAAGGRPARTIRFFAVSIRGPGDLPHHHALRP